MSQYTVGQYENAADVVKSDATVLSQTPAIYVGGTGNVNVVTAGGQTVLFTAVPAGTLLPVRVSKVLNTNTTATLMTAVW